MIPQPGTFAAITSEDLTRRLQGARQFLDRCFFRKPDPDVFELLYGCAAMASVEMRRVITRITVPAEATLPRLRNLPSMYGDWDAIVRHDTTTARAKELIRGACGLVYDEVGHSPFLESTRRFSGDLAVIWRISCQRHDDNWS